MTGTIEGGDEQTRLTEVHLHELWQEDDEGRCRGGGDADPSGAATLWAHKALSAGRPLPFGVEVVSRFTVAAPAEEESWRSTSR